MQEDPLIRTKYVLMEHCANDLQADSLQLLRDLENKTTLFMTGKKPFYVNE